MRTFIISALLAYAGGTSLVFAQASIAGSVTDPSDVPLPGVIVEATSASLIERSRTTITDKAGRYRIEDLRPGIYAVTFTLAGWRPYHRDGLELSGSFTATVNA
ncbi:MAG TPA: carboxypeptidase-like regulatory domain-containing protein, partial [Vicinamibacterales bacterium]